MIVFPLCCLVADKALTSLSWMKIDEDCLWWSGWQSGLPSSYTSKDPGSNHVAALCGLGSQPLHDCVGFSLE